MNSSALLEHASDLVFGSRMDASPEHLKDQIMLRRAISASYYALFHPLCALVADEFVGRESVGHWEYSRCYRSVEHRRVATLFAEYVRAGGANETVKSICNAARSAQAERHRADYDPDYVATWEGALDLMSRVSLHVTKMQEIEGVERKRLAAALVFSERRSS